MFKAFFLSFYILCILIAISTDVLAGNECPTTSAATSTQYISSTITLKILLVEFPDVSHRTSPSAYTKNDFENLLISSGTYVSPASFSPDNEIVYGSLSDYYQKMSNGNVTLNGYVINTIGAGNIPNWVMMTQTKAYYYSQTGTKFLNDAVNRASNLGLDISTTSTVKLVVIYAGNTYLQNPGPPAFYSSLNPRATGSTYIMSERQGTPYNQEHSGATFSRIGYHCHEFAHTLGIDHSTGLRADVMEAGYRNGPNNNGAAPAPLNPISRLTKGWITAPVISGREQLNLNYSLTSPQVKRLNSSTSGYYFLVEYRRFDRTMTLGATTVADYNNSNFMPIASSQNSPNVTYNHGILVWRVKSGGPSTYSDNGLIYASGRYGASYPDNIPSETDAGDLFPGTANVKLLAHWTDTRTPFTSTPPYNIFVPNTLPGQNVAMEIIEENSDNMRVDFISTLTNLSSSITSNTTLTTNSVYYATSNVTVNTGVILTIQPGVKIFFANGASLIVNGTLNVNGTSGNMVTFTRSGSSGSWGGIEFGSSGSGTISYANINYAANGVKFSSTGSTAIEVANCVIENNTVGVYAYSSSPRIHHNRIRNNTSYGVRCQVYSSPYFWSNVIYNNSNTGLYCNVNSSARLATTSNGYGNNVITGNTGYGVDGYLSSNVFLGTTSSGGYNSIYSNSSYEVRAAYSSVIAAENNWWSVASYPYYSASDFTTSNGGSIDYIPALSYNPNSGLPKTFNGLTELVQTSNISYTPFLDEELKEALQNKIEGKYEEAAAKYLEKSKKEKSIEKQKYILTELAECYRFMGDKGYEKFKSLDIHQKVSKTDGLYALTLELENYWHLMNGDYDKAIANLNEIKTTFSKDKEKYKQTLYCLGLIYGIHLNNKEKAKEYFGELESKYPNDQLVYDSKLLLGENVDNYVVKGEEQEKPDNKTTTALKYTMMDNFPNPFNPSTTISFTLPEKSSVALKIFDVLGREVATLVSGIKESGEHKATFNASNLPSGVYIYSIQAGTYSAVKKMLLVK